MRVVSPAFGRLLPRHQYPAVEPPAGRRPGPVTKSAGPGGRTRPARRGGVPGRGEIDGAADTARRPRRLAGGAGTILPRRQLRPLPPAGCRRPGSLRRPLADAASATEPAVGPPALALGAAPQPVRRGPRRRHPLGAAPAGRQRHHAAAGGRPGGPAGCRSCWPPGSKASPRPDALTEHGLAASGERGHRRSGRCGRAVRAPAVEGEVRRQNALLPGPHDHAGDAEVAFGVGEDLSNDGLVRRQTSWNRCFSGPRTSARRSRRQSPLPCPPSRPG